MVTFFAVTDRANMTPNVAEAYRIVRGMYGFELSSVHSVRRVTRLRSSRDAGRFGGFVMNDVIADQRRRTVTPAELGVTT